jgi:hypothetical protein
VGQRHVVGAVALEIAAAERGEGGPDLDRVHVRRAVREQRREIAAAGADLEHPLVLARRELLHDARLDLRRHHLLALADRDLHVGEGERATGGGQEVLARHGVEQVENRLVEHLPGADLLLHHVGACLIEVHGAFGMLGEGAASLPKRLPETRCAQDARSSR